MAQMVLELLQMNPTVHPVVVPSASELVLAHRRFGIKWILIESPQRWLRLMEWSFRQLRHWPRFMVNGNRSSVFEIRGTGRGSFHKNGSSAFGQNMQQAMETKVLNRIVAAN